MLINLARQVICTCLHKLGILETYQLVRYGYLRERGWRESFTSTLPRDPHGDLIPWMNYAAIDFLRERMQAQWRVFEYGSGASTCWWAKHVSAVVACEHDLSWVQHMRPLYPSNVTLLHIPLSENGDYCRAITTQEGSFDIVVSDGRDRVRCLVNAVPRLSPRGVMILDDFERDRYQIAKSLLHDLGFRCLVIRGLKAQSINESQAAFFYRHENVLGL